MGNNEPSVLELILQELKEMRGELKGLNVIVAKQEENLQNHMKRSDNLEELIKLTKDELEKKIEPVQSHVIMVQGVAKFLGILGTIVAILGGLFEFVKSFL